MTRADLTRAVDYLKSHGCERTGGRWMQGDVVLWRISTIRRHDPALAARCLALVRALESTPKAA